MQWIGDCVRSSRALSYGGHSPWSHARARSGTRLRHLHGIVKDQIDLHGFSRFDLDGFGRAGCLCIETEGGTAWRRTGHFVVASVRVEGGGDVERRFIE